MATDEHRPAALNQSLGLGRVPPGRTLIEVIRWRARHHPERPAYCYLKPAVDDRLTYGELDRRACLLAGWLQQHAKPGDRALLVYGGGLDVAVAFWACLYAGLIAVPAPPPDPVSRKRKISRLKRIAEDSDACFVLSSGAALDHMRALSADLELPPGCRIVDTSAMSLREDGDLEVHRSTESDLAFLQYTSGSTAEPKGVMVTHGNLLVQCRDLHIAAGSTEQSRSLTWMPYFHDFGLIHGLVAPIFAGQLSYLMSPLLFMKEPVRWLEAITAHGITHSGAPNFGYEHCLRGIDQAQRTALDLTRWEVASCGAEPIREATMARFIDAYQPYGFRAEAFSPAYGMAECTLVASLKAHGALPTVSGFDTERLREGRVAKAEDAARGRVLVGCGMPIGDMRVAIVDPETQEPCHPDAVGEVWLSGGSVARGYWNRPADTDAAFGAYVSVTGEGPFLRTGDLGFLRDGQLFITGRLKDLIIVHGRNHYPQDIELTVESCHPALRPGGGAAFAVDGDLGDQLVVVQEVQRQAKSIDPEELCAHIRRHVAEEHELHVFEVVLITAGGLPKTSSGKVQRRACRDAYLGDRLPIIGRNRLAPVRSNGNLEFLGRADHQVKLRGHRIELEEIEAVLRAYPGVEEAVVVLREDAPGEQRLVAYYTGVRGPDVEKLLQTYAASQLPSYMVPALLIHVDTLPRTAAGKVDRRELPVPHVVPSGSRPAGLPSTSTEATLVQIWREILQLPQVGVDDNFFYLGGHSLLATQVVSRVRETFRIDCPLRAVFEHPTVAELACAIDRLRQEAPVTAGSVELVPVPRDRPLPLSFSQQRMWFMYHLSPESTAYNMPLAIRLLGPLDRQAVLAAAHDMVKNHEAFRTTFSLTPDGPTQQIHDARPVDMQEVDLCGMPVEVRAGEAARLVAEEARRPFDLQQGPLARFGLIRIDDADHILVLNMHHIIGDQWSFAVIGREFARLYNEYRRGRRPFSKPSALQYADVAVWQRRTLTDAALAGQLAYWQEKLAGLPVLTLPTDYPRPQRQSFVGSYRAAELSEALIAKLRDVCAGQGGTLFMGLLAAFQILLSRYSGQDDIAVGVPIANRTRRVTEDIIGTFVNTLVMRTDLSRQPTFAEAVDRVRETALGAYAHQDLPFERLVSALAPDRDLSHAPLVQVLFNVANAPIGRIEFDGLAWMPFEFDGGTAQFDLTMTIDTEISRKVFLSYRTDLFAGETVERMIREYVALLEAVAADPHRTITEYDCMSPADRQRLLIDWNRTEAEYPSNRSLPELIAMQAASMPDAVAVVQGTQRLTYAELEHRANQLANYLLRRGVRTGACVGLCLERTPSLLVGVLGVLKCGAAYVPLDPEYPIDRLHYMLEDSGADLVLTSLSLTSRLPVSDRTIICLDREQGAVEGESAQAPAGPEPSSLAYVLYTSGSTGRPKGVAISHRSLVNFLWSMKRVPGCSSRDRLLAVTTLSFDIAGLELYLPLIVGGTVELVDRRTATDGLALKALLTHSRPTIMQATPATWRMLIDAGWESTPGLKVLCGGEALSRDLADRILERAGSLWNMYGPTETTIWSTVAQVTRDDEEITIGRPIANTQLYVLDSALRPVPIGVPGELYIGGEGLALGYHRRPELTAERFIVSPFTPAARLYKTGDLVRYRSDGQVVHLGRLDRQVKIRGFRIELGEIEAALMRHPVVHQAVVSAKPTASGTDQLVAYTVLKQDARLEAQEMKAFLRRSLPDYMVPAHFIVLPRLPLTANGKVDVAALPAPDPQSPSPAGASAQPVTLLQIQLMILWRHVLGLTDIGIHDNFFDLGGDSLKAVQLFAHLERLFGQRFPLATLFQAPTIARLSDVLTASQWEPPWRSLVAIQPLGTSPPIFAVPGVGGNVLCFTKLAQLLGPDQPFFGLQTRGLDGREAPFTSIVDMAAHYVEEIRRIQRNGPFVIAGTCTGGVVAFEMAQQLLAMHEPVILIILESWHPLSYNGYALRMKRYAQPFLYGWSRALRFLNSSRRLSLSERWRLGLSKLAQRLERIGSVSGVPTILGEEFTNQRVAGATLEAVASYRPREYQGTLLNVTASLRAIDDPARDTRTLWEYLARGGAESASIPASDSGQLFISPQVEVLTDILRKYIRKTLSLQAAAPRIRGVTT